MSKEREHGMRRRQDLEAELHQLAQKLDVPAQPDYATWVRKRLASGSTASGPTAGRRRPSGLLGSLRPLTTTMIVLLFAVVGVLAVPATRDAVADLFGLSGVRVRPLPGTGPSPSTTLDASLALGDPVTLDEARRRVSFTVSTPSAPGLGAPEAVYVRRELGLESVSLVYRPRAGFPAAFHTQVGLLVSEYSGTAAPYFEKLVTAQEPMTRVAVDGRWPGVYFTSPHLVMVRGPDGVVREDRPRLAAPTLVWERGGVTYRLEAAIDLKRALAVASSMP